MLDTTLQTEFVPGTNVKGEVAGANWLFLLPSLELGCVLCIGNVAPASLVALARVADDVVVLAGDARGAQATGEIARAHGLTNVRCQDSTIALPQNSVTLVMLGDDGVRQLARDAAVLSDLPRVLRAEGLIYLDHKGGFDRREASQRLAEIAGSVQRFWLTPIGGEMHTAVPDQDASTKAYFLRYGLTSRSFNLGALKRAVRGSLPAQTSAARPSAAPPATPRGPARRGLKGQAKRAVRTTLASLYHSVQGALDGAEQRISGSALLGGMTSRYGILAGSAADLTEQPPRYLRDIARASGVDIEHHRWGLSARGEYSSRKVLVFLFNHADEAPEYIVKMTRDPALNPRLENEHRALLLLAEHGIGDRETLPRVAFFGHHRRLAVLGQTIVDGEPFERRASGRADCPHARDAIAWLTELGARTVDRAGASPLEVAEGLGRLFRRFAEIYRLEPAHRDFLEAQIATIANAAEAFPLVFQHGDPGTWNAMVAPSGRTAFLDWEAAESQGMPLWDLFYFVRTYGAWSLGSAVSGDVTKGFASQFLGDTPFQALLAEAAARYCDRVGVPQQYVEPLFYTCWMHRALKEATRLSAGALDRGHYVNVLRASVDRREALQKLFAAPVAS